MGIEILAFHKTERLTLLMGAPMETYLKLSGSNTIGLLHIAESTISHSCSPCALELFRHVAARRS